MILQGRILGLAWLKFTLASLNCTNYVNCQQFCDLRKKSKSKNSKEIFTYVYSFSIFILWILSGTTYHEINTWTILPPVHTNWSYPLVLSPCLTTWPYLLVLPPGLTTCSYQLFLTPGLTTWSYHLVLSPGPTTWSYSQYFWVNHGKIKNMFWRLMFTGDIQKLSGSL